MAKVWCITGTSRGLGRVWALAALERGDSVVATARDVRSLDGLVQRFPGSVLPLALDVRDRAAAVAAVAAGVERFGRLDVVVNNAGYGLFGAVEELTEQQVRDQLETNLFGALWVTQAALPVMRAQGHGHLVQVSSIGGVAGFALLGGYNCSKWALEGLSEALAQEVGPAGVHVTIVEPGPYSTDWGGDSAVWAPRNPAYDGLRAARRAAAARQVAVEPEATARAVLELVDMAEPPLRLFLGTYPYAIAERAYAERLATWQAGRALAATADGAARPAGAS
ncbi:SDR family NAD(P)-dependent oxidoreductase [Dactylosporangium matsuzakiense]|uniref:Short-chain dehydrogenase/reductase n=1 Tax=Dactylosporangium matsuzakiense TaxID=53360 RepID=A0A9W6NL26_9ACTN|nr:SDR family NAD(P)-dependent oxidoreductase [Dactylosporangium matsuzakiense]UWZ48874.1 SDR family NAD(P)-dependent oxidoreductase [Dactylosporangium matsuzakiense]GLL00914.1 short-chain dehydrogenase/reductase [Dactylosporangium matsuzakiense]